MATVNQVVKTARSLMGCLGCSDMEALSVMREFDITPGDEWVSEPIEEAPRDIVRINPDMSNVGDVMQIAIDEMQKAQGMGRWMNAT